MGIDFAALARFHPYSITMTAQHTPSLETIPWPEYNARWAPIQDAIFSRREPEDGAFVDAAWPVMLLVGGLDLDDDVFLALAGAAAARGDDAFVVAYRQSVFEDQPPVRAPWTFAAKNEVGYSPFSHVPVDVFGASATWGLMAHPENFAVLAAAPAVMDDFLRRVDGGGERLRADFERTARDGWIGHGELGRRYADALMRRVGWAATPQS